MLHCRRLFERDRTLPFFTKTTLSIGKHTTGQRYFHHCRMASASAPLAAFPILKSVQDVRSWRKDAFEKRSTVGFVPTMGALHEGHLELGMYVSDLRMFIYLLTQLVSHIKIVRQSLKNTERTICSIFVNPAQFAPSEDLSTYPRTLEADLEKLSSLEIDGKKVQGLFLPSVGDLYPDGIEQDVSKQRGTFVDVVGFSQEVGFEAFIGYHPQSERTYMVTIFICLYRWKVLQGQPFSVEWPRLLPNFSTSCNPIMLSSVKKIFNNV